MYVKVDESTHSAVEALQSDRDLDHKSEAAREALALGLGQLGYFDGRATPARRVVDVVAIGVFHVGATLVLLSLFGPVSLLFGGTGALAGSLTLAAVSRVVIPRYEPQLSNKLPTIEVR